VDWQNIERLRAPGFTLSRRGYDKREVDKFLEQLVDWLETDAANDIGHLAVTRKLELVGKSTEHILLTAEQEAQELKKLAETEIAELREAADTETHEVRAQADIYAKQTRSHADEDAERTRDEANAEASETIEEALRRRGQIDEQIRELETQRDRVLEELSRLRAALGGTIDEHGTDGAEAQSSSQSTLT
jgi:DivIVA domain-containing protein